MIRVEDAPWAQIGILCPFCGNRGEPDGKWEQHGCVPFKLTEQVVRLWEFFPRRENGVLFIIGDTDSDEVDWESGDEVRFLCMQCFSDFPIPGDVHLDFEQLSRVNLEE